VSTGETCYSQNADGIRVPEFGVTHREHEFDSRAFEVLLDMQGRHFWYRGRHRFIHHALERHLGSHFADRGGGLAAVDLGGGCGGWIDYLQRRSGRLFRELALADSALGALQRAGPLLPSSITRYQIDLLHLGWRDRWDVAFLLDVLEHLPQDTDALVQVREALRPGGWLFVTTPALRFFWSYNDELAHHVRRYSRADFAGLAGRTGLRLVDTRYFMFLLSPLLWLARLKRPAADRMTDAETRALLERKHRVPPAPINALLTLIFAAETPAGHWVRFPWGTSLLGVFQKSGPPVG
jgi:SAM-dependent methyltransferase